jgi:hypothetical protein
MIRLLLLHCKTVDFIAVHILNYQILIDSEKRMFYKNEVIRMVKLNSLMYHELKNDTDRYSKNINFNIYNTSKNPLLTKIAYYQIKNAYLKYMSELALKKLYHQRQMLL